MLMITIKKAENPATQLFEGLKSCTLQDFLEAGEAAYHEQANERLEPHDINFDREFDEREAAEGTMHVYKEMRDLVVPEALAMTLNGSQIMHLQCALRVDTVSQGTDVSGSLTMLQVATYLNTLQSVGAAVQKITDETREDVLRLPSTSKGSRINRSKKS